MKKTEKILKKFVKIQKYFLTYVRNTVYSKFMTMIRKAIKKRMKELKLNPNQLYEILKHKIPRQTIYDFLSGKTDARTEVVSALIKVLGLELRPIAKKRKKKAR